MIYNFYFYLTIQIMQIATGSFGAGKSYPLWFFMLYSFLPGWIYNSLLIIWGYLGWILFELTSELTIIDIISFYRLFDIYTFDCSYLICKYAYVFNICNSSFFSITIVNISVFFTTIRQYQMLSHKVPIHM